MPKVTTAVLLSCLLVPVCFVPVCFVPAYANNAAAAVPSPLNLGVSPATRQFVSAYTAYAQAVKDQGAQGVKKLTTSDFSLRQGRQAS